MEEASQDYERAINTLDELFEICVLRLQGSEKYFRNTDLGDKRKYAYLPFGDTKVTEIYETRSVLRGRDYSQIYRHLYFLDLRKYRLVGPPKISEIYETRNLLVHPCPKLWPEIIEIILEKRESSEHKDKTTDNKYKRSKCHIIFEETLLKSYQRALGIQKYTNNLSLDLELTTYEVDKYERNDMIIFNHENFLSEQKRLGTAFDVTALENAFKPFRFRVTTYNDLTVNKLFLELRKFSRRDFRAIGCICVAILTHGQDHGYLRAFDTRYCERDVIACFDARLNPSLVGKPIIFLIQACRGRHPASTVDARNGVSLLARNVELDAVCSTERLQRPMDSDIIMFHSAFFGRASFRVAEQGTWFIQTLCEQIRLHAATDHLEEVFRRVRTIVAHMEYEGARQMPVVTTTLLKKLYLKRRTLSSSDLNEIWRNAVKETLALMPPPLNTGENKPCVLM